MSRASTKSSQLGELPSYNDIGYKDDNLWPPPGKDFPPQYRQGQTYKLRTLKERELEDELIVLWRKVWLGLYEVYNNDDTHQIGLHYDRLETLYHGAGMTNKADIYHLRGLKRHFLGLRPSNGIASMRLFDHISVPKLKAMIEILRAYESEIKSLQELYSLLRNAQLDLKQLLEVNEPRVDSIRNSFLAIAGPMGERLIKYDIRMDVLMIQALDEAVETGDYRPGEGQHVFHLALSTIC